jgi:hypothetical protein
MSDTLRTLNQDGIATFATYLQALRDGGNDAPPSHLLTDPAYSDDLADVQLDRQPFPDSYGMGLYLQTALASLDRRKIPYNHALWTWLALYFFDQICPAVNGKRKVLEDAIYILAEKFNHQRYYRHLVRTPWLAVTDNGENAKIILKTKAGGKRSDIFEQLVSRQGIFGNKTVIGGAYKLYYDVASEAPKRGASGKGAGSSRRLAAFIQQIDLTYDLRACSPNEFLNLLPTEFDRYKGNTSAAPTKKSGLKAILAQVVPGSDSSASATTSPETTS